MTLPAHGPSPLMGAVDCPRATLLCAPGEIPGVSAAIWMGGAQTHVGEPVQLDGFASAWVLDCAGDMPAPYRDAAGRWISFVFADLDAPIPEIGRLDDAIERLAAALVGAGAAGPTDLFVVCQHGMNRSGLAAGLLLSALGMAPEEALARVTSRRKGSLSNQAFRDLILRP